MIINDLKALRSYTNRYGMSTRRADNPETGVKVVQLLDAYGCVWRSGKGESTKTAWLDLCGKVFSANRPPRKPPVPAKEAALWLAIKPEAGGINSTMTKRLLKMR